MSRTTRYLLTASLFAAGAAAAVPFFAAPSPAVAREQKAQQDIVDTAVASGKFNTLAAALKAAGLVDTLKGAGPFTVFAPTDEAFAKLPKGTVEDLLKPENKDKLTKILTHHVVAGKVMSSDIKGPLDAKTVANTTLAVKPDGGKVMVGNATVTAADVAASNGVIHVIDTVLLP